MLFERMPIDISEGALKSFIGFLESQYSQNTMPVVGLAANFDELLAIKERHNLRHIVIFLRATFGNAALPAKEQFVRQVRELWNQWTSS